MGAVNSDNQLATFSNPAGPNPLPLVLTPGVEMLSTDLYQDYNFRTGTSMAAPHVAGVVALMLEANPTLTPAQVQQILIETAIGAKVVSTNKCPGLNAKPLNFYRVCIGILVAVLVYIVIYFQVPIRG